MKARLLACTTALLVMVASGCKKAEPPKVSFGFALDGYPISEGRIAEVARETSIQPKIVLFYLMWPEAPREVEFPAESLRAIEAAGGLPVLTWEPMFSRDGVEQFIDADSVVSGRYDEWLRAFARRCREHQSELWIRFAHEMNLARYNWGGGPQDDTRPERYKAMFRHVVNVFREENARNVRWIFCANAESIPPLDAAPWNTIRNYYPGDEFVDVLGVDGYNWGRTQRRETHGWDSNWRSFADIFRAPVGELRALSATKPLLVFETASASDGDKNAWLRDAVEEAGALGISGLVWFQVNKETDWRIQTGTTGETLLAVQQQSAAAPSLRAQ